MKISKLTIFRDITDRKHLEEERICAGERQLQLLDELEKANVELKDFAYSVSHDLKAPLRAITSLATLISTDYGDKLDEEGKVQLDLLLNRVKQMHNLIESILQYSRYWKFDVADDGPGIEARYYDNIFQIFQTLKPRDEVESTGVGLSIVNKIVESQRGKIWVHSKVGAWSTFFFTVPKEENEL